MNAKKRILVVDDDKPLANMVKMNLEGTGDYEVCIENHSTLALQTARNFKPDLILLDYIMPGLDGGDVSARLHEDPFLNSVPIIMVTALISNREMGTDGTSMRGGRIMLAKPIKFQALLDCIEKHLAVPT
jgi:CheY-like chemotaxis protein